MRTEELVRQAQSREAAGDLDGAIDALESASRQAPTLATLLVVRSSLLADAGRTDEAAAALDGAIRLTGRDALRLRRALLLPPIPDSLAALEAARTTYAERLAALASQPLSIADPLAELPYLNFYLAYHGENDRALNEQLARMLRRACPSLSFVAPHCGAPRRPSRSRPRIGFFSSHFRDHTIGLLNEGLVRALPASQFEKVLVTVEGETDAFTSRWAASMEHTLQVPRRLDVARELIAQAELDLLHHADIGMDPFGYLLAFARLAPVQSTTWGHPVTSGLDTIDWFLSHADLESGDATDHYTERLLLLDAVNVHLARPSIAAPLDRSQLGLPPDRPLLLCPQNLFKLHPSFDPALAAVLRARPEALLVFLRPKHIAWETRIRARLQRQGVDDGRQVAFIAPGTRDRFLSLLSHGDVMLDPFHFGGGHTTLEALAVGTPVVTWPSQFLRGRLSRAFLLRTGDVAGIAASPEDWVTRVEARIADRERIAADRPAAIARSAPLFADPAAVTAFAHAIDRMLSEPADRASVS